MENRNILFGVIGLLILAVVGLAVDRSNQISTLSTQATTVADDAQTASDNMSATIEAQVGELDIQAEAVSERELAYEGLQTQAAVSSTVFENDIAELESAIAVLETNNTDFVTQVADLSDINDTQATEVADLSAQRDDLSGQRDGLATEVADLTSQLDESIVGAEAIQTQIADGANIIATLEADNILLQEEVQSLIPTETPTPEPTVVAEVSALDFALELDIGTVMVQIAPDSASIAILRADNVIEFVSAEDGTSQRELTDLEDDISDFIFSNSGRSIAAISSLSRMLVFDSATGVVSLDEAIRNPVKGYDFAGDDGALAVLTGLETEIFPFDDSPSVTRIGGVTLDWSADGAMIVQTDGSLVEILTMDGYQIDEVIAVETDSNSILDVEFSPDGSHIAGYTADGMVMVWSVPDGEVIWSAETGTDMITDMDWSGDSANLAVIADGDVSIYSADGTSTTTTQIDGVTTVDWSADSSFVAFGSAETVYVVSADTLAG